MFYYKLITRSHARALTEVRVDFGVESQTRCRFLSPHAEQTVAETQNTSGKKHWGGVGRGGVTKQKNKIKFAALNVLEHHIESLGVTNDFFSFLFLLFFNNMFLSMH